MLNKKNLLAATLLPAGLLLIISGCQTSPTNQEAYLQKTPLILSESEGAVDSSGVATLPEEGTTTLVFGGDVMLSRVVGQKMEKYRDFSWPFKKIAGKFSRADIAIVNLESPFTYSKNHLVNTGSFSFNADPKAVDGLRFAGIDLVALANNHFGNQGKKGMSDTFSVLQESGVAFVGGGKNIEEAHQPAIIEKNGIVFSFLNYGYPEDLYVAGTSTPGIAAMDIERMKTDVAASKKISDVTIVIMHAGIEYVSSPNRQQTEFARQAIDSGADLVVGHHPHWVQTTEIYQGKPILYSLGNLVFDQMWSTETRQGALAEVSFRSKEIRSIKIIPLRIDDYGQATAELEDSEKNQILRRMGLANQEIKLK